MILLIKMLSNYNVGDTKHYGFTRLIENPSTKRNKGNNQKVLPKLVLEKEFQFSLI